MRTVNIFYNPYINSSRLFIDKNEHTRSGRRIDEFIVGQPIDNWLSPYTYSYHRWDGLLAELMDDLNEDEIELFFYSLSDYVSIVTEELQSQAEFVEGRGYSSNRWKCECVEYYHPEKIKSGLLNFIQTKKHFVPDQYSMNLIEYCEQGLMQKPEASLESLQETYKLLRKTINAAKEFCTNNKNNPNSVKVWDNAEKELLKILGGKGTWSTRP